MTEVLVAKGIVEAIDAGDRLALYALADEYEAAGCPLAPAIRRIAQGDREPSAWKAGRKGLRYSWLRHEALTGGTSGTMRLGDEIFDALARGRPAFYVASPEECYARDYTSRTEAYLDLARALS